MDRLEFDDALRTEPEGAGAECSGPHARSAHGRRTFPSLSVIIPVKNQARYLPEQLESLTKQRYAGQWEVIIVDNGSDDGSVEVARGFAGRLPRLRVVHSIKVGAAAARNVGTANAKGDAFLFCDADDVSGGQWLPAMGAALRKYDFVAGGIELERLNEGAPWRRPAFTGSSNVALLFKPFAVGCNVGVTRRAFTQVGGFDESMKVGEDVDFSWRLQLQGYAIADAPDAIVHYRYRQDHAPAARQTVQYSIAHVHLYKRYAAQGMPRWPLSWVLDEYRWLVRNSDCWVRRGDRKRRQEWVQRAAERAGRLLGSMRYRALYL